MANMNKQGYSINWQTNTITMREYIQFDDEPTTVPLAIAVGYLILKRTVTSMGRLQ